MNNEQKVQSLREIVDVLIQTSLLLSFQEKQEFLKETPALDFASLLELFNILTTSKRDVDEILNDIATSDPDIMNKLNNFQIQTLKSVFKEARTSLINNPI